MWNKFVEFLKKVVIWLQGKKSYFVVLVYALYELLKVFSVLVVTDVQDTVVKAFIAALFGLTMAAKVNRMEKAMKK